MLGMPWLPKRVCPGTVEGVLPKRDDDWAGGALRVVLLKRVDGSNYYTF